MLKMEKEIKNWNNQTLKKGEQIPWKLCKLLRMLALLLDNQPICKESIAIQEQEKFSFHI